MKYIIPFIVALASAVAISACSNSSQTDTVRMPVDTIGFAQYRWQVDSVLGRIERLQQGKLSAASEALEASTPLRVAISPHDDYSYVGYLYPALLQHVNSDVVILFGVGHKARNWGLEDRIVFGSFGRWKSPGGEVQVSGLQKSLQNNLPGDLHVVHDSLQTIEHSIEALIPFLEYYNPGVEIIPVIVPAMSFERMEAISEALARAVIKTMDKAGLEWGSGWSIVITTDAVHYGNEDWGGKNYDRFGVDSAGYMQGVAYEENIMNTMLTGRLSPEKIKAFSQCTVQDSDYHEYKWTWCGRYAVPLGLLTAYRIAEMEGAPLTGIASGYSTSIANSPIPVYDLGMGITAPAKLTHWVGYAAVGYR
ncbi:MAG: AmmeMemoRadiSam system protein B [Bacteroidales bacterium]|nr:AmmeMemoRadiSam system protein B [Bacteroidales bacterium]